jgi:hypothetical protein
MRFVELIVKSYRVDGAPGQTTYVSMPFIVLLKYCKTTMVGALSLPQNERREQCQNSVMTNEWGLTTGQEESVGVGRHSYHCFHT